MPTHREIDWYKNRVSLFRDEYSCRMAQDFFLDGVHDIAVFEMFCRKMPKNREYLVAFGADSLIAAMENFRFTQDDLDWMETQGYEQEFLEHLKTWKFSGQIYAMLDGTVFFPNEPIVQVVAPIWEAALIEGLVLSIVHRQTCIGTKATRIKIACGDKPVIDFSLRGAHGMDDDLWISKTSHLSGFSGTSSGIAAKVLGIESKGTMAHLYVLSKDYEEYAFIDYARRYPGTVVLIDTYNTMKAARKIINLKYVYKEDFDISAVRIDSYSDMYDLVMQCRNLRKMFNEAGLNNIGILPTGDMEEYKIAELLAAAGDCVDGLAVGRQLADIDDAPKFNVAYKLVEFKGKGRMKTAYGKYNYPLRKQVIRNEGNFVDVVLPYDKFGEYQSHLPGEKLLVEIYNDKGPSINHLMTYQNTYVNAEKNRTFIQKLPPNMNEIYLVEIDVDIREAQEQIIEEKEVALV